MMNTELKACFVVFDQHGMPVHTNLYAEECHQHINEMCEIDHLEAGKWVVREMQLKAQSPVVPEVPKAVIRSVNLKWFDEDDINGTKNALVLRFKNYENIVPFVHFLADLSISNKEGA